MSRIGIFYGSTLGTTRKIAQDLAVLLGEGVDVYDVAQAKAENLREYPVLFFGCSTWGYGELQDDWNSFIDNLDAVSLEGKKVALFGCGDQEGYADTFVDALGILYDKVRERRGSVVGTWPVEGFNFGDSKGVRENRFVGLPLDENNQPELTEERLKEWVASVKEEILS